MTIDPSSTDGGGMPAPPSSPGRQVLDRKIALRRARLAALETGMIAAFARRSPSSNG